MNIQEGGRENAAVFWLLSHRSSVAGSSASQMTERERERGRGRGRERERERCMCGIWKELLLAVLDIYSFLKQWGVWWKEASYATLRTGSILLHSSPADCSLWSANVRTCLHLWPADARKRDVTSPHTHTHLYGEQSRQHAHHETFSINYEWAEQAYPAGKPIPRFCIQ